MPTVVYIEIADSIIKTEHTPEKNPIIIAGVTLASQECMNTIPLWIFFRMQIALRRRWCSEHILPETRFSG